MGEYDFEKFLITVDLTGEGVLTDRLFEPLGQEYIDTPGYYSDEYEMYDGILDFMRSNMGRALEDLEDFYTNYQGICDDFVKKSGHKREVEKLLDFELTNY